MSFSRVRTRGRINGSLVKLGTIRNIANPDYDRDVNGTKYESYEITRDDLHPRQPNGTRSGGPFSNQKVIVSQSHGSGWSGMKYKYSSGYEAGEYYEGDYALSLPPNSAYAEPESDHSQCQSYGPTCWNKFKPGKPKVSATQTLWEARELANLKEIATRVKRFRDLGKKYLAYEFGWKPFLSDVRNWYTSLVDVDRNIAQLRRDNGRWISRGGTLFANTDSTSSTLSGSAALGKITPTYGVRNLHITVGSTYTERVWFKARFRYYIPGLSNPKTGRLRAIKHLYDLEIGPEQLWQILPWSWLADWFSNTGDVISNVMSAHDDQLVGQSAWVMRQASQSAYMSASFNLYQYTQTPEGSKTEYPAKSASCTCTVMSKGRAGASPFGFNLSLPDFDARKIAILSALGISRFG